MIEAIQNRAARFISQKYSRYFSATQIKIDNSLEPLETRRAVAIVCLLHKYVNCSYLPPLPLEAPVRMSNRLNNQRSFKRIYGHTQAFNSSALPTAITLWNDLPNTIVSITDHTLFRNQIYRHYHKNVALYICTYLYMCTDFVPSAVFGTIYLFEYLSYSTPLY